ncbi:hypothetical protein BKE38_12100 [Pseudoroseomonas deserti]|uniref:Tail terminator n=1 Tax=Teichococcus deserti TaxID=1817963 RepID=A0A1V2H3F4_9PROT|nr:phage tail terminator-like protein [Pseudoroseomonas deserti]ONG53450.1 hypothetical protein BKE38_12100 [Pseudoroseomonas deserti]
MASPEAWLDARSRIEAAQVGVPIEWPNEPFEPPTEGDRLHLVVEMAGHVTEPAEMGQDGVWLEDGTLYMHVLIKAGAGSLRALVLAKHMVGLFRGLPPGPMAYRRASIGAGHRPEKDGEWWCLTASVDWVFQDRTR